MIVADASAVVEVLTAPPGDSRAERLSVRLSQANGLHVPYLIDTEVQSAIRGLVLGFRLPVARAARALESYDDLMLLRYPTQPLARAIWEMRDELTTYDATYVALATVLGCPLVTCDRKLASAAPRIAELF